MTPDNQKGSDVSDADFYASFKPVALPSPLQPGARVFIAASHPWGNHTGTIREVQQLFGGGTGYAVEVDGAAGSLAGCRASDLTVLREPAQKPRRKGKR